MEFIHKLGDKEALSWVPSQEFYESSELIKQTNSVLDMPNLFKHAALMPDAHGGFGVPIGGVVALQGALCPEAVGYDIGCGMLAVQTDLTEEFVRRDVHRLLDDIFNTVPCGEGKSFESKREYDPPVVENPDVVFMLDRTKTTYTSQLGTLGGGNHFIEIDSDESGRVWVVVHSGSRGFGHSLGGYYMKLATDLNQTGYTALPTLDLSTEAGQAYDQVQNLALEWAKTNRYEMMHHILRCMGGVSDGVPVHCHHNFAALEHHFGEDVFVHRKGATRAASRELVVIPANMGEGTAIVRGKANVDSFMSSSHGTGRKMSRGQARRTLDLSEEMRFLSDRNITLRSVSGAHDEMTHAYKGYDEVMERQTDLVEVVHRLTPIGVVKG